MKHPSPPDAYPWIGVGRLLPTALRTRVFEPAYYDLLSEHRARTVGPVSLGLKVGRLYLECLLAGGPMVLCTLRRPARRVRIVVGVTLVLFVLLLVITFGAPDEPANYSAVLGP